MNEIEQVRIIPSEKSLGAEVVGVDLSLPLSDELRDQLVSWWTTHLVLLFRNQHLTQESQIAATRLFGEVQVSAAKAYKRAEQEANSAPVMPLEVTAQYEEISVVHNLDQDGNPVIQNENLGSGVVPWHSDNSYISAPPSGSMLYAKVVPPVGGETCFADQYRAYETLPEEIRLRIDSKTAVHDSSRDGTGTVRHGLAMPTTLADVPGPHHPLVRTHPVSGRKCLYLGRRRAYPSQYVDGLSEEESTALLAFLWEHATQEELVWCHRWREGDVLLWDNRCTMHSREPFPVEYRRIMYRTMIQGEVPV